MKYPIHDDKNRDEKVKPGTYLGLFHGFKTEEQRIKAAEAGEWGKDGAMIGPLKYVHTTYACDVKFAFEDISDAIQYGLTDTIDEKEEPVNLFILKIKDECIEFDGMRYGDWIVFTIRPDGTNSTDELANL